MKSLALGVLLVVSLPWPAPAYKGSLHLGQVSGRMWGALPLFHLCSAGLLPCPPGEWIVGEGVSDRGGRVEGTGADRPQC